MKVVLIHIRWLIEHGVVTLLQSDCHAILLASRDLDLGDRKTLLMLLQQQLCEVIHGLNLVKFEFGWLVAPLRT